MLRRSLLALASLALMACNSGYESTVTYRINLKNGDISGTQGLHKVGALLSDGLRVPTGHTIR